MSNVLEYKGYHTKVQYDADSNSLHGKIEGIKDFVNFETENIADVENEFHKRQCFSKIICIINSCGENDL